MTRELVDAVDVQPTIRPQLPAVVDILRSTLEWYRPFTDPDDLDTQHDVDLAWAEENFEARDFWSATLGDEVVGVITMQDTGDHLYLGYVYVHREHVGKRIGRALLDKAAAEAQRRGKKGMVLLSHPDATWAIKAYTKYGFECIASTDDAVVGWNNGWLSSYHETGFQLWQWNPPTP